MRETASEIAVQARARLMLAQRQARPNQTPVAARSLESYQFDPHNYIIDKLHWTPWEGTGDEHPGQKEVLDAYSLALKQQYNRDLAEHGMPYDTNVWTPDTIIKNRIRIEAGHTVGKTKLASGIVNHFFDTCVPSIIYTFAPSWEQIHDLLWKEIKTDRRHKGLPGRIQDLALIRDDNHFAKGRAANNMYGTGTERAQGQHGKYLMFVLDEAEGIPDFIYDAVESMSSGGIAIVLMLANPRTRTSKFHKEGARSVTKNFRISCLNHPNVIEGREIVPGAVRRQYVDGMLETHATLVNDHNPNDFTFSVPWHSGKIWRPDTEFLFRVLGIAPLNISDNTLVPLGRYLEAKHRPLDVNPGNVARLGLDMARYGKDAGTLFVKHGSNVRRAEQFYGADTQQYQGRIESELLRLHTLGVTDVELRVDAGGGYGAGIADNIRNNTAWKNMFMRFKVHEVHFNAAPYEVTMYHDLATELYANAAEALQRCVILDPPDALEADLTERVYRWVVHRGISVKQLESKDDFRARIGRSPDDGDGFCLAVGPDHLFAGGESWTAESLRALSSGKPL